MFSYTGKMDENRPFWVIWPLFGHFCLNAFLVALVLGTRLPLHFLKVFHYPPIMLLTPTELETLRLLARSVSYAQICERLLINQSTLHTRCSNIRKKTGIRSTKDPIECHLWLVRAREPRNPNPETHLRPTRQQLEVMRLVASGHSYRQIGQMLEVNPQSAQNSAAQGCKRAGIFNQGWNRTNAIREYLANMHKPKGPPMMNDPMF